MSESHQAVPAHTRRTPKSDLANTGETVPFFDEARVPIQTITVLSTEMKNLQPEEFEVIGQKISYRLAHFMRFRNGKVVENISLIDSFDAVEQVLGHPLNVHSGHAGAGNLVEV